MAWVVVLLFICAALVALWAWWGGFLPLWIPPR
jgi:hypothetical protein